MDPSSSRPLPQRALRRGFLSTLLDGEVDGFLASSFGRNPVVRPASATPFLAICDDALVDQLLDTPCDLLLVRNGAVWPGPRPRCRTEARAFYDQGWTYVMRNAQRWHADLGELAQAIRSDIEGVVNLHIYATPRHSRGFGWHFDEEEVIVLQLQGWKRFWIRENTSSTARVPPGSHASYLSETSPIQVCDLAPGDWMHIPAGWWHAAKAVAASLSLSAGILPIARHQAGAPVVTGPRQ